MAEPFLAEIRIFAGNFAPRGWALCNGQALPIAQNTALFSLVGTFFGGDGRVTFALPDLRGRLPMHAGRGPGLTLRRIGETLGTESVTLAESQVASHTHALRAVNDPGDLADPAGRSLARASAGNTYQQNASANLVPMNAAAITETGGNLPHSNLMPYLTLNFIIALQGEYPT